MADIQVVTQDFVNVHITKSGNEDATAHFERRFKKTITIPEFKTKLELVTGGSAATMKLKLYDKKNNYLCDIDNDDALLGSYPIDDGMRIHVVEKFALLNDLGSSDSAERFRIYEEGYEKKGGTMRSFLQRNRFGKYSEEEMVKLKEQQQPELENEARIAEAVFVGDRCEVRVPQQPVRLATVRYNGPVDGAKGLWIGVQYDEPLGKNDGSLNGKSYFTCPPKYGGFVKPVYVTVGDRGATLLSFLQRNRLGKYNEDVMVKRKEQQQQEFQDEARIAEAVLVGDRCEVRVSQQPVRRATVRYNGPVDGAKGLWIGVQYDEPLGKNDGSLNGKRYFTCPPKYGGFVKPVYVTVGDRCETLLSFLKRKRLGKYNEEVMVKRKEQQQQEFEDEARIAAAVLVGDRCEVRVPLQPVRRATVRYNGPLDGAMGLWIGVQYDEPLGKNDGSLNGQRYFHCPSKYGGFVKPGYVTVGDFPEEEFDFEDEIWSLDTHTHT